MSVEKSYFDKIAEYGQLVIISGPSGVGKSTVITNYIAEHPNACKCVSVTTRPPRADEEDGEDHYFVTHQEFEQLIRSQQLLEYVYRGQNGYGTPKNAVEKLRRAATLHLSPPTHRKRFHAAMPESQRPALHPQKQLPPSARQELPPHGLPRSSAPLTHVQKRAGPQARPLVTWFPGATS